jgi:hypothetical protein
VGRPIVTRPPFVGRQKESAYVRRELEAGRSIVLSGIYGIGRTSLVRQLAAEMAHDWHFVFVDAAAGPADIWREVFGQAFPASSRRLGTRTPLVGWTRFRVLHRPFEDSRRHVIVLDNLARLSARRVDLARRTGARCPVIAIVESFLPSEACAQLALALRCRAPLQLGHLSLAATIEFFEVCSSRHGFGWAPGDVRGLARATRGFPLAMRDAVDGECRRRAASESTSPRDASGQ